MTMQLAVESLVVVTYSNVPVITTGLLAHLYKTEEKHIRQNFKRNECRFIAGKHFFKVSGCELDSLRTSQRGLQISPKTRSLILWTERGAARHAKMLETDRAWEVFEKLEDCYFSQKIPEQLQLPESTLSINYPLSWFSEHHPYSMMSYVDRKTLNLDVSVLFDMPSPTMRILNELHSKGYNVDAAVAEFNAFKHLTEEMRRTLQDISRLSDRNSRKGFSLSL
ncbi:ORF6N domain-containing protein [Escherichia coli]|uniref:ORF6N domain-containing protein n=1 Tax=Escherichia coli TaxID=562 RepID=UPI00053ACE86|nr:ORF6N domain-containing protein [Escherichia coli]AVD99075.1 antitermination [Escherichia phage GER2]EFW8106704.1 ORF6N domain-containing protein [Shigella sonnei]EIG6219671.1 ORF6N domain-containing protein [Shigella dysenteriae]EIH4992398.1 ORF6N domain-containing protein [Shigella boydii]HDL6814365.1 ORF6N domain-containing protein [Escherichia coli 371_08]HDL6819253.1 ORF6N domain-containing protein [Escherichia coli 290_10]HDL6833506.1 ORF6N domain-containing protein [Escherichia col